MSCDGKAYQADLLLADIKNYLDITWDDQATDDKIRGLILSGIAYLDSKRGIPSDYFTAGFPQTMLKEFVRYARDNALDVFENNYLSLILAMQNESAVNAYVETTEQAE